MLLEPVALLLSIVALRKIRDDPNPQGRGMAIAGMVISIGVLVPMIFLLLIVFIPLLVRQVGQAPRA
jgi:hypothetical protein